MMHVVGCGLLQVHNPPPFPDVGLAEVLPEAVPVIVMVSVAPAAGSVSSRLTMTDTDSWRVRWKPASMGTPWL
jgi:hypothetical protein